MDINDLRGVATVLVMIAFAGVCWWAFSPKRKQGFTDAANLPFADDAQHQQSTTGDRAGASSENVKRD
jgi:cytochrome c oxidase cbb3-type subunit 4